MGYLRAHPGRSSGVHPSSGSAGSDPPSMLESSEAPLPADVAAPEDGRTPAQSAFVVLGDRLEGGGRVRSALSRGAEHCRSGVYSCDSLKALRNRGG